MTTAREKILALVSEHYNTELVKKPFIPGETPVLLAGRVFDDEDVKSLVASSLDFWLTAGPYAKQFEKEFAQFLGVRQGMLCNSGSSANLLAITALTSPLNESPLVPGDEVITVAAGFPTTVAPIIQNGLVPVFVDINLATGNIDATKLEAAVGPRTRAVMLAHTLGNPFDVQAVLRVCNIHNLTLIEDNCDALGSRYNNACTGTFGALSTASFYPAHHITMGEGGAVMSNRPGMRRIVESFRDWGRDCWCDTGCDNTCGKRFGWIIGDLPPGYDHKYIYSHLGYNLKLTDMQAAIGVSQLRKLPDFIKRRKHNWNRLHEGLQCYSDRLILHRATNDHCDPSWFGFLMTVRDSAGFSRAELITALNDAKIGCRLLFGGNLTKQPAFAKQNLRISGGLDNTDYAMHHSLWIGVYPGIDDQQINYVLETFAKFMDRSWPRKPAPRKTPAVGEKLQWSAHRGEVVERGPDTIGIKIEGQSQIACMTLDEFHRWSQWLPVG